ncbi:predicted protein [Naegleria gruberi]|uniref:Predicted protein n=1 Tax=Naegleria gruberi TaxID=5762 RepID=D2V5C8_NAEGR|nr:uncharacterized protein NAEGRDRAFT_63776 [Naegleria gruberi]EFC48088.1 predicted protein [Naegleria gruberi]|eukprot:XP_002680832.1 predicted protein [Naegleria gruberi strain NEG-M]
MRFWSKLFKSVRRNEEGDDTITPSNISTSSSSSKNKPNRTNSPSIISKKIYDNGGGADDESQDSSNSNGGNSIDYAKLNLEDVFDLEGIEVMCREAEDLNLIEL